MVKILRSRGEKVWIGVIVILSFILSVVTPAFAVSQSGETKAEGVSVEGVVLNNEAPIETVITLEKGEDEWVEESGENGEFLFENLLKGEYKVSIEDWVIDSFLVDDEELEQVEDDWVITLDEDIESAVISVSDVSSEQVEADTPVENEKSFPNRDIKESNGVKLFGEEMGGRSIITGTWGTSPWSFNEDTGVLTVGSGSLSESPELPWLTYESGITRNDIEKIVFTSGVSFPVDSSDLLSNLGNLNSIVGLESVGIGSVEDMSYLFSGNLNLVDIGDLSDWNISSVKTMSSMFRNVRSLEYFGDLSNWDMSTTIKVDHLFYGAWELSSIGDISTWDTSNITDFTGMFYYAKGLESVGDLSNWDLSSAGRTGWMFSHAEKLSNIGNLSNWDVSSVTDMTRMFDGAWALETVGDISNWDVSSVQDMEYMFQNTYELDVISDLSDWDVGNVTNMRYMFSNAVVVDLGNLDNWNVEKVTDMSYMFSTESTLENVGNLDNWNVGNVTNMQYMFHSFVGETIGDISGWNTENVTSFNSMFRYLSSIKSLDLSGWDTSSVNDINYMFQYAGGLVDLDLSDWDVTNLNQLRQVFDLAKNLESLDITGWDTRGINNMWELFYSDTSLKKIAIGDNTDLSSATDNPVIPDWEKTSGDPAGALSFGSFAELLEATGKTGVDKATAGTYQVRKDPPPPTPCAIVNGGAHWAVDEQGSLYMFSELSNSNRETPVNGISNVVDGSSDGYYGLFITEDEKVFVNSYQMQSAQEITGVGTPSYVNFTSAGSYGGNGAIINTDGELYLMSIGSTIGEPVQVLEGQGKVFTKAQITSHGGIALDSEHNVYLINFSNNNITKVTTLPAKEDKYVVDFSAYYLNAGVVYNDGTGSMVSITGGDTSDPSYQPFHASIPLDNIEKIDYQDDSLLILEKDGSVYYLDYDYYEGKVSGLKEVTGVGIAEDIAWGGYQGLVLNSFGEVYWVSNEGVLGATLVEEIGESFIIGGGGLAFTTINTTGEAYELFGFGDDYDVKQLETTCLATTLRVNARTFINPSTLTESNDWSLGDDYRLTEGSVFKLYEAYNDGTPITWEGALGECTIVSGGSCDIPITDPDLLDTELVVIQTEAPEGTYFNSEFKTGSSSGPENNRPLVQYFKSLPQDAGILEIPLKTGGDEFKSFGAVPNSVSNPKFSPTCDVGIRVALVLDESGSIGESQWNTMRDAIVGEEGLLEVFARGNASVSVLGFATTTQWHTGPTPLDVKENYEEIVESIPVDKVEDSDTGNLTNWSGALREVEDNLSEDYDFVLFITDGAPNYLFNGYGEEPFVPLSSTVTERSVEASVYPANAIKQAGVRLVGVGVTDNVNVAESNIRAISGDTIDDDYFLIDQWEDLKDYFSGVLDGIDCDPVDLTSPVIEGASCTPESYGSYVFPEIEFPEDTDEIEYEVEYTTVTDTLKEGVITATAGFGYSFEEPLPQGWVLGNSKTATYIFSLVGEWCEEEEDRPDVSIQKGIRSGGSIIHGTFDDPYVFNDPVNTISFKIDNTGDVDLIGVELSDSIDTGGRVVTSSLTCDYEYSGWVNGEDFTLYFDDLVLEPGDSFYCSADYVSEEGQDEHTNWVDVNATDSEGRTVDDYDYFHAILEDVEYPFSEISLTKGVRDGDSIIPGTWSDPYIFYEPINTISFKVENTGEADLIGIQVEDTITEGGIIIPSSLSCDYDYTGDVDMYDFSIYFDDLVLEPGDSFYCSADYSSNQCNDTHTNEMRVTADSSGGFVEDEDYFHAILEDVEYPFSDISITKGVKDGEDILPGSWSDPYIVSEDDVENDVFKISYLVENTGETDLSELSITDYQYQGGIPINMECDIDIEYLEIEDWGMTVLFSDYVLKTGESFYCTGDWLVDGWDSEDLWVHENNVNVSALGPFDHVHDYDEFVATNQPLPEESIKLEKGVRDGDDIIPGSWDDPYVYTQADLSDDTIILSYKITNDGEEGIWVTDLSDGGNSRLMSVSCEAEADWVDEWDDGFNYSMYEFLAPGDSFYCTSVWDVSGWDEESGEQSGGWDWNHYNSATVWADGSFGYLHDDDDFVGVVETMEYVDPLFPEVGGKGVVMLIVLSLAGLGAGGAYYIVKTRRVV